MEIREYNPNNIQMFKYADGQFHGYDFSDRDQNFKYFNYITIPLNETEIKNNNNRLGVYLDCKDQEVKSVDNTQLLSYKNDDNPITLDDLLNSKEASLNNINEFHLKEEKIEDKAKHRITATSTCQRYIKYDCPIIQFEDKVIYKGFDTHIHRSIAWCEIKSECVDEENYQTLLNEIEKMIKLNHPNILKYFDVLKNWFIIFDGSESTKTEVKGLVIIQELLTEDNLKSMIERNFNNGISIPDNFMTKWWYQILDALRYIHCQIRPPLIHRNLKAENCFLFVDSSEEHVNIKISDFALVTTITSNSKKSPMIGPMVQEAYEEKGDAKSDMYAFGNLMFEVMMNETHCYDQIDNIQFISKAIEKHFLDNFSNMKHPLIKEIILSCLHPNPSYRPTAEELCEHSLFQYSPVFVELLNKNCSRSPSLFDIFDEIFHDEAAPIINLQILFNHEYLQQKFSVMNFFSVTLSIDVYQSYKADLSELLSVLKSSFEKEIEPISSNTNLWDNILSSIKLQIQYIIKVSIGERWRRIFNSFLNSINQKQNAENIPYEPLTCEIADTTFTKLANYNFNLSLYHKTSKILNVEIENHCRQYKIKTLPYFSNIKSYNKQRRNAVNDCQSDNKTWNFITNELCGLSLEENKGMDALHENNIRSSSISFNEVSSNKGIIASDIHIRNETLPECNYKETCSIMSMDFPNVSVEEPIADCTSPSTQHKTLSETAPQQLIKISSKNHQSTPNEISGDVKSIPVVNFDQIHFRHFSEPVCMYTTKPTYPVKYHYPIGSNSNSGGYFGQTDIYSLQHSHNSNNSHLKFNQDTSHSVGYGSNINTQAILGSSNILNQHLSHHQQAPFHQYISYIQPPFLPSQPRLLVSSQSSISGQNRSENHCGIPHPYSLYLNTNNNLSMQNNIQYTNPMDHTSRHQTAEPILTRSLPSIIGNPTVSSDNVVAPTVMQTSMAPVMSSRMLGSNDVISSPRQMFMTNSTSQKLNPLMSTNKSVNRIPSAVSPVPPSKVQEKSKTKKSKTRIKSKYLIKITELFENPGTSEKIVSFEVSLPMNQIRLKHSLNNEINCPNFIKSFGDSDPLPNDLRKKEILESLVTTVKKMCQFLKDDINSVSVNEDYVFHPLHSSVNLLKFSDCNYQMQISSEIYESAQSSNTYAYLNTVPAQMPGNTLMMSCTSSRSLSRHASTEDLSWTSNSSVPQQERPRLPTGETDAVMPGQNESGKSSNPVGDLPKKLMKQANESEASRTVTVTPKCSCVPASKDCCFKIPELLVPFLKQITEKLQNPHTKGLIILPQPNDILLRNPRVLEIPPDHMFCGLPCADSSFNVVKGQKDKYFIIAKDSRQSDSADQSKKCVYQISPEGAVLVDSTGEIQYLQNPSVVIPQSQCKAQVKELPFELTHNKNQLLDCNQIVSVLQSLSMNQNLSELSKDETFDSPVLLKPVSQQSSFTEKPEVSDFSTARRGSGDSVSMVSVPPNPSQVHVDLVSLQYVPLTKSTSKPEMDQGIEISDRDLPRQQVRNRKISNESLDAALSSRNRIQPVYMTEVDHPAPQSQIQKMIVTNSMGVQNVPRPVPVGTIINQMPIQRLPNVPGASHSGQYVLATQNQMAPNLMNQNYSFVQQYGVSTSGASGNVVISQSNSNVPVMLTSQPPMGLNFSPIVPNQVVLSSNILTGQMSHVHMPQSSQLSSQRMPTPTVMPISSQHISNMTALPMQQGLMNFSQSIMPGSTLPGYCGSVHTSIPSATSEQHYIPVSLSAELINVADPTRQMAAAVNPRQMSVGSSQYYESNINNSILSDHNMRIRTMQPSSTSIQSPIFIPYQNLATSTTTSPAPPSVISASGVANAVVNQSKIALSDQLPLSVPTQMSNNVPVSNIQPPPESDKKSKAEQTIGRFVIRPVTETNKT